jgi:hypothetical protein
MSEFFIFSSRIALRLDMDGKVSFSFLPPEA